MESSSDDLHLHVISKSNNNRLNLLRELTCVGEEEGMALPMLSVRLCQCANGESSGFTLCHNKIQRYRKLDH